MARVLLSRAKDLSIRARLCHAISSGTATQRFKACVTPRTCEQRVRLEHQESRSAPDPDGTVQPFECFVALTAVRVELRKRDGRDVMVQLEGGLELTQPDHW
jgi:hypothetical protein